MRLATSPWRGTEPLFLARELGQLDPQAVQLVELADVAQGVSALLEGMVAAAAATFAEALRITARAPDFRVVLAADDCDGADVLVVQPEMTGLAALKGARIGLEEAAGVRAALSKSTFPDRALHARHLGAEPPAGLAIAERLKATLVATQAVRSDVPVAQLFDRRFAASLYR